MPDFPGLVGKKFGRLYIREESFDRPVSHNRWWVAECDCGKTVTIRSDHLTRGETRSCGCINRERLISQNTKRRVFREPRVPGLKSKLIYMTGRVFYRLTVIERNFDIPGKTRWLCRCSCGNYVITLGISLRKGYRRSCGCLKRERTVSRNKAGRIRKEMPIKSHPLHSTWRNILDRCENPNCKSYPRYGGKRNASCPEGIKVCARWHSFWNFVDDMPPRPSRKHQIHRIDNEKGYEPGNCVWLTIKEHALQHPNTHLITVDGITDSIYGTAARLGIGPDYMWKMVNKGYEPQAIADQWKRQCQAQLTLPFVQ